MTKSTLLHIAASLLLYIGICSSVYAQVPKYPSTITVAQDGSASYKTIQEAINSIRDLGEQEVKIYLKNGIYKEKLIIPSWKIKISLIGESAENTIITNADYSGKANPLEKDAFGQTTFSTYTSFTVLVQGNDIHLENLILLIRQGGFGRPLPFKEEGIVF